VAEQFNAHFLNEGEPRGLNDAIRFVVAKRKLEKSALLVVHADLPLLTPLEVRVFLEKADGYPVVIAPSKDESGTNAMLLQPAEILRPSFGKDSYKRHISILDQKGIPFSVQSVRGFGFDIDEPKDLLDLMQLNARANTENFLKSIRPGQILQAS
jgi:2-phospho-L-lactate guanylyltransferase